MNSKIKKVVDDIIESIDGKVKNKKDKDSKKNKDNKPNGGFR